MCGSLLAVQHLPTEDRARLVCGECGYVHYVNPHVVGACLPIEDGMVWLLRRGIEPRYGYWTYPAGYQEVDESTEGAAIRETLEELGCLVELERLLGVYSRPEAPVVIVYLAHLAPGSPRPSTSKEAIEVRAFLPQDIPWRDLAFPSTHQALHDWVEQLEN
jgi:ADP-ribose pyrophosphatase YjhB (NUDIX family)